MFLSIFRWPCLFNILLCTFLSCFFFCCCTFVLVFQFSSEAYMLWFLFLYTTRATLIFVNCWLLLVLYSFPLISQISLKFSSLFYLTFISCLYNCLSTFVLMPFLYSFLFLWYVSAVSPLCRYHFFLALFFPSYSSRGSLSVVSPTLCRASLPLFVVSKSSVTCHRSGQLLFSILSVDIIFSSFLLLLPPPPPPTRDPLTLRFSFCLSFACHH